MISTNNDNILELATAQGNALAAINIALINNATVDELLVPGTTINDRGVDYSSGEYVPLIIKNSDNEYQYQVKSGQSLFDVAMQTTGTASSTIDIALKNRYRVDEMLEPSSTLRSEKASIDSVVKYLNKNRIVLATGDTTDININLSNGYVQPGYVTNGYVL